MADGCEIEPEAAVEAAVRPKIPARYHKEITEFARRCNRPLYDFLFRFTRGDRGLTEDLMQQVLIEAAVEWPRFRRLTDRERTDELLGMATRRAIDIFRKNKTARDYLPKVWECSRQPETDPHHLAVTAAAIERFLKALDTLPQRQFLAATLYWRCGWRNSEIAKALGVTAPAITQLLNNARDTLRRELGPYLPFELNAPEGGA